MCHFTRTVSSPLAKTWPIQQDWAAICVDVCLTCPKSPFEFFFHGNLMCFKCHLHRIHGHRSLSHFQHAPANRQISPGHSCMWSTMQLGTKPETNRKLGLVFEVIFYGFYHGIRKSPLNHHFERRCFTFPSLPNSFWWKFLGVQTPPHHVFGNLGFFQPTHPPGKSREIFPVLN